MPKDFYTERDIEDMVKRGILSLEINDNVVLTDLAYEKANRLGMKLVRDKPENPPAPRCGLMLSQQMSQGQIEATPGVGCLRLTAAEAILPSASAAQWWPAWGTRWTRLFWM